MLCFVMTLTDLKEWLIYMQLYDSASNWLYKLFKFFGTENVLKGWFRPGVASCGFDSAQPPIL